MGGKAPMRILCLGDSLTEGYYSYGRKFSPYGNTLQAKLDEQKDVKFEVTVSGHSGWTSTELVDQLKEDLAAAEKKQSKFDFVFILAGTNDMGHEDRKAIGDNLKKMHETALAHGARTIAIAVPHHGQEPKLKWLEAKRKGCNEDLKEYAEKSGGKVSFFDLASKVPMFGISEEERAKYWDDTLHYNAAGYARFGELIYEHFTKHTGWEVKPGAAKAASTTVAVSEEKKSSSEQKSAEGAGTS